LEKYQPWRWWQQRRRYRFVLHNAGLHSINDPNEILSTLEIRKPWNGKLTPVEFDRWQRSKSQ